MRRIGIVTICLCLLAACSSSSKGITRATAAPSTTTTVRTTTTTAPVDYGAQYRRIVAPVNVAQALFERKVQALGETPLVSDVATIAGPFADSIDAFDQRLLRAHWPPAAVPDIKALVIADAGEIEDLHVVSGQTSATFDQWSAQLSVDFGKVGGAVSVLRADLGLAPAPKT